MTASLTALLIEDPTQARQASCLTPKLLTAGDDGSRDEKWLQKLIFDYPQLLPLSELEAEAGHFLPLCQELPLPRGGRSVYSDLLGVTRSGRLVIVECKLWRNPQSRREVIAQITEYAAILRRWSFSDLSERLKKKEGWTGANPLFDLAKKQWPDLEEAKFVDGVTRSLAIGDFYLLIVGDGIRSDTISIVEHMAGTGAGLARLGLVEIQLWTDARGRMVAVPRIAVRTEVLKHRVLISGDGQPLIMDMDPLSENPAEFTGEKPSPTTSEQISERLDNKAFWQRFIGEIKFDHAEQPPPRHRGNNFVHINMPAGAPPITAYRWKGGDEIGLFLRLKQETGRDVFSQLKNEAETLDKESEFYLKFYVKKDEPFEGLIEIKNKWSSFQDEDKQISWLKNTANRLVSLLRPRLKALYEQNPFR